MEIVSTVILDLCILEFANNLEIMIKGFEPNLQRSQWERGLPL